MRYKIASWLGLAAGCFLLYQGIRHYPMAYEVARHEEFAAITKGAADFLAMSVLSIGALLIMLGFLCLYFCRRIRERDKTARAVYLGLGVLFLLRTLIELKHPVALASPSIPSPSQMVLITVCFESLLFFAIALLSGGNKTARDA